MFKAPSVAMMQPHFLPWMGYLELLAKADIFVLLDDFQFSRQSWGQRNRIFTQREQVGFVTVPVDHQHAPTATYNEVRPVGSQVWRRKFGAMLGQVYGPTAVEDPVAQAVIQCLDQRWENLADQNVTLTEVLCEGFGIDPFIVRSGEVHVDTSLTRSERIRAILKALKADTYLAAYGAFDYMAEDGGWDQFPCRVLFQDHWPVPYKQRPSKDFVPYLSSLDAVLSVPKNKRPALIHGTGSWLTWDERAAKSRSASAQSSGVLMSTLGPAIS